MDRIKNDLLVLGYFGYETNQLDGQTVKTRNVHALLEKQLAEPVAVFDTESLRNGYRAYAAMFRAVLKPRIIIYLPAHRNLRLFLLPLYFIAKLKGIRLYYIVIGGWLPGFAAAHRMHRFILKRLDGIFVETKAMLRELKDKAGFKKVVVFPNFRIAGFVPGEPEVREELKLVFLSRVTLLKGVDRLFEFSRLLLQNHPTLKISLDLFGPVDPAYHDAFESGLKENDAVVTYKGVLQPDQIFRTLAAYDVMLFPTRYPGEGCPGAILDAYIAGIPVIATGWRYNSEFVVDGITGFVYSPDDAETLTVEVMKLYNDRKLLNNLKAGALIKSREYSAVAAWQILLGNTTIPKL